MPTPGRWALVLAAAVLLAASAGFATPSRSASSSLCAAATARGYEVVPWANLSPRILDVRTAWMPPLFSFTGPGLLLSNDPHAAGPAAVAAMSSPAPNGGVADYDFSTGRTRNLTFPLSMAGAFGTNAVTPFVRDGRTFLLTLGPYGDGVAGNAPYTGHDIQVVAAGLLDVPDFRALVPLNLSVPLTTVGFSQNDTVGVSWDIYPDGANVTAYVGVSRLTGGGHLATSNPPWVKYVYFANLTQVPWTEGEPLVLSPIATIPWAWPVTQGFKAFLTPAELMIVTDGTAGPSNRNVQFVNVDEGTWSSAYLPGRYPVWSGRIGPNLFLLEDDWQNASNDAYVLNRVALDASGSAVGVSTVWDKVFPRPTPLYATWPVVTGGRLDVFLGVNGYAGYANPTLTTVYSYDLVCGTLLGTTYVDRTMPLLGGPLQTLVYPSLPVTGLVNGFLADRERGLVFPLDLVALRDAAAASRHASPCASCTYAAYVTDYAFPRIDLLLEEQYAPNTFESSPETNLTSFELTANATLPGPMPPSPGNCALPPVTPLESGLTTWDAAFVAVFLAAGLVAVLAPLYVITRTVPRRPPSPPGEPPPRSRP